MLMAHRPSAAWHCNWLFAWHKLLWVLGCGLIALFFGSVGVVQGQTLRAGTIESPFTSRIEQRLFLDDTQQLDLTKALDGHYRPFDGLQRLPVQGKTAWIKVDIERAAGDVSPLQLRVLPPVFDSLVLYSPDPEMPNRWQANRVDPSALFTTVPNSALTLPKTLYLQVNYAFNSGLILFIGNPSEMTAFVHRMDIVTALFSAVFVFFGMAMFKRALFQFSWMSLAIATFFIVSLSRYWLAFGYANSLLGLDAETVRTAIVFSINASLFLGSCIYVLLAQEIFLGQRMVSWLWAFPLLFFTNMVGGFFVPYFTLQITDSLLLFSALASSILMILWAVKSSESLAKGSTKLAFVMILFINVIAIHLSLELKGISAATDAIQSADVIWKSILIRLFMPLVIMNLANWSFNRIRKNRFDTMRSALLNSQSTLELESKRLLRQRNFTTMLAHELKNPLTASHMALSCIQQRLGADDPARERAETIKTSLQEIDAIIDRCAEIDGYEQGQMPMAVHAFSLRQLMIAVKVANPSERIYTVMRGIDEDAQLKSDMQYIKIILSNLLTNALKYSPTDSLVELEIHGPTPHSPQSLMFRVHNEIGASGLPEPERVFERFYRAEAARNQSGAGLGLWLAQSLAHALSSEVIFTNDKGRVSFSFSLPTN